jgi:hypothetical protein
LRGEDFPPSGSLYLDLKSEMTDEKKHGHSANNQQKVRLHEVGLAFGMWRKCTVSSVYDLQGTGRYRDVDLLIVYGLLVWEEEDSTEDEQDEEEQDAGAVVS